MFVDGLPTIDTVAQESVRRRLDSLTKPEGSLGQLEHVTVRLAGIRGYLPSVPIRKGILLFAGDHGIARRGVSAYPQRVTREMLRNFDRGGAAVNVLAKSLAAELSVVDVGVRGSDEGLARVRNRRILSGTRDFTVDAAMTADAVLTAIAVGREELCRLLEKGVEIVALGEMGIGNTSAASAITSVVCGLPVAAVTGSGTGLDSNGVTRKVRLIEEGIARNNPHSDNPLELLAAFGGAEIAALVGAAIESAKNRVPIVLDGFIVGAAALLGDLLVPGLRKYLFAGHVSTEPGHRHQLARLELDPVLALDMRLGEGTGAALALGVIEAAVQLTRGMLTFEEASVSKRSDLYLLELDSASGDAVSRPRRGA